MGIENNTSAHRTALQAVEPQALYNRFNIRQGLASNFDPEKAKVRALSTLAPVAGRADPAGYRLVDGHGYVSEARTICVVTRFRGLVFSFLR